MTPGYSPAHLRLIGPAPTRIETDRRSGAHCGVVPFRARPRERLDEAGVLRRNTLLSRLTMVGGLGEDAPLSFVAVRVCGLGELHERRGWVACEEVLRSVANGLGGLVRATDTVGRLNASTFGVVLQGTGATAAASVAARLTYRLNRLPEILPSVEVRVGAATGTGENVDTLAIAAVDSFDDDAV
jgi:GGDEF domain-containing protein